MANLKFEEIQGELQVILREGYEGSTGGSYFIDGGEGSGLFAALARLGPEEASRPIGGSTVAAHTYHLAFGLEASAAWIRGDRTPRKWRESWSVSRVDDGQWTALRQELRTRYDNLQAVISAHALNDADSIGGAIGVIAHSAYHLGAIKQKLLLGR